MEKLKEILRGLIEEGEEEETLEEYTIPPKVKKILDESKGKPVTEALETLLEAGLNPIEAHRTLYYANKQGVIHLVETNPPTTLAAYALSWHSAWAWAVVAFLALTTLSVFILPQNPPWIYMRYITGAIYVLYVPGATFIEALYPKREELEDLERFALGVGLSLALVPLVGLVLNYTPWGIRLVPVYTALTILTLILVATSVIRKYGYHMLSLEGRR